MKSNRRNMLMGAAAVVAAGAGAGWSWYRQQPSAALPDAAEALWKTRLATPSGGELDMSALRGKPLVLNFWATWCPPCVKEMPQLERFHKEFGASGWQVAGFAIDSPTPVREFLVKTPVTFPIGLAGMEGTAIGRALGNDKGALPYSVVFDAKGVIVHRKLGETSFDELAGWAKSMAA